MAKNSKRFIYPQGIGTKDKALIRTNYYKLEKLGYHMTNDISGLKFTGLTNSTDIQKYLITHKDTVYKAVYEKTGAPIRGRAPIPGAATWGIFKQKVAYDKKRRAIISSIKAGRVDYDPNQIPERELHTFGSFNPFESNYDKAVRRKDKAGIKRAIEQEADLYKNAQILLSPSGYIAKTRNNFRDMLIRKIKPLLCSSGAPEFKELYDLIVKGLYELPDKDIHKLYKAMKNKGVTEFYYLYLGDLVAVLEEILDYTVINWRDKLIKVSIIDDNGKKKDITVKLKDFIDRIQEIGSPNAFIMDEEDAVDYKYITDPDAETINDDNDDTEDIKQ